MPELYLKQLQVKEKMEDMAEHLNFYAPESRKMLESWIDSVSIDWPISKRRFYATEVPMWYCEKCNAPYVPPKGKYYQPWREPPPIDKCPKCGHTKFRGETRVFDTWFDSSITPLYILGYERHPDFFKKHPQCTLRPQGKEIIRTWLYYTLLKCHLLTGKQIFRDAWINHHIVDDAGRKMSKSLGNMINPQDIVEKYGAESLRLWTAIEGDLTHQDSRCSFDRIAGAGKTLIKLWNVAKFVSMFPQPSNEDLKSMKLSVLDKWILQEMNRLVKLARHSYECYDFHNPAIQLKHFIWDTFASHYLELAKNRAYNTTGQFSKEEQIAALYTLNFCLKHTLELLAPILPFISYKLYSELYGKDIHKRPFPTAVEAHEKYEAPFKTEDLEALNSAVWKAKKDKGLSLKAEVAELVLPEHFRPIEKDLQGAHSVKVIVFEGKEVKIKLGLA
jgi:valyl-tRNA synthetase